MSNATVAPAATATRLRAVARGGSLGVAGSLVGGALGHVYLARGRGNAEMA